MSASSPTASLRLLTLSIAAVGIQALMFSPLLTDMARGLATGPREMGLAAGAYGVGVAAAAIAAAPRLGVWPKRTVIRAGFAVLTVGLLLCAFAFDWRILGLGQLVVGLATGVIIPSTYALTGDVAAPEARSQAMGKVLFGWSIAMVAGVPLAAFLSGLLGWRGTFMAVAAVGAIMVPAGALLPQSPASATAERTGYLDVLRLPGAFVGYVATFAYMISFYQTYTFLGDHVRRLYGAGAWLPGLISLSYGLGFGAAVATDRWIDRHGPRKVMPFALAAVALNYVLLPAAAGQKWLIAIYPFVWGFLNHVCMTSLVSFLGALSPEKRGTLMGLFSFVTYVSLGTAGAIYGSVYAVHGFWSVSLAAVATLCAAALLTAAITPDRSP